MTGRGRGGNKSTVICKVDKNLLDSLSRNLLALKEETGDGDGASAEGESGSDPVDSSNLNSILHHILRAVNVLTENIQDMKKRNTDGEDPTTVKVNKLEERLRRNEDETDECCQRSMKGNFVILSKENSRTKKYH